MSSVSNLKCCTRCRVFQPFKNFSPKGEGKWQSRCKSCVNTLQNEVRWGERQRQPRPRADESKHILTPEYGLIALCGVNGDGLFAKVDLEDFEWLTRISWRGHKSRAKELCIYARSGETYMHTLILQTPTDKLGDHINGDTLDNRRLNLRVCDHTGNMRNKKAYGETSKFKGVSFSTRFDKWQVSIYAEGKRIYLGRYNDEEEAARAYDAGARKHHGEFARLNFP